MLLFFLFLLQTLDFCISQKGSIQILLEKENVDGKVYLTRNIGIGTPRQNFSFLFNPVTQYSWLPSDACPWYDEYCHYHPKFVANRSSTYLNLKRNLSVPYLFPDALLSTFANGQLMQETVCLDTVCASKQPIILSPWNESSLFIETVYDGVFGLGYATDGKEQGVSILQTFYDEKTIDSLSFTFELERNPKNGSQGKGQLVLGRIDPELLASNISYVPIIKEKQKWEILIDKITINGNVLPFTNNRIAVLDMNYPHIGGPYAAMVQIYHAIGATPYWFGHYNVSCDQVRFLPDIVFHAGEQKLIFKGEDYISRKEYIPDENKKTVPEMVCETIFSGFEYPVKYGRNWTFGVAFLERYATIFDMEGGRIGFAEPKKRYYGTLQN